MNTTVGQLRKNASLLVKAANASSRALRDLGPWGGSGTDTRRASLQRATELAMQAHLEVAKAIECQLRATGRR